MRRTSTRATAQSRCSLERVRYMNGSHAPALHAQSSSISPWPVFWIASVAVFLVSIDVTVLYAAFPALRRAFPEAGSAGLSWVLNAYTLVFAALLVPAG